MRKKWKKVVSKGLGKNICPNKYAAAAAKSLQSCPTLGDPIDGSPPGSPSLGFSRQEHWSGLPFPSPSNKYSKVQICSMNFFFFASLMTSNKSLLS